MSEYIPFKQRLGLLHKYLVARKNNDTTTAQLCLRKMKHIAGHREDVRMPDKAFVDFYKRKCLYPDLSPAELIKTGQVPVTNHFTEDEELFSI